jgi:hypothetical protein
LIAWRAKYRASGSVAYMRAVPRKTFLGIWSVSRIRARPALGRGHPVVVLAGGDRHVLVEKAVAATDVEAFVFLEPLAGAGFPPEGNDVGHGR